MGEAEEIKISETAENVLLWLNILEKLFDGDVTEETLYKFFDGEYTPEQVQAALDELESVGYASKGEEN